MHSKSWSSMIKFARQSFNKHGECRLIRFVTIFSHVLRIPSKTLGISVAIVVIYIKIENLTRVIISNELVTYIAHPSLF